MSRTFRLDLRDILAATSYIQQAAQDMSEAESAADTIRQHSVIYNLMVIGEAAKNLPATQMFG